MNDLISRQATIDVEGLNEQIRCEMCRNPMHTNRGCDGNCKYDEKLYERIMQILGERIKPSPSAESERKKGKWIKIPEFCGDDVSGFIDNHFSCSECKKEAEINQWGFYILSDFCPNCGADMRIKETDCDYERAVEQLEHDMLYEPTFNQDDGSM